MMTPEAIEIAALRLRVAELEARPVLVKPLVWEAVEQDRGDGSSDLTGDWIAETSFGCYSIVCGFGTDSYTWDLYYGEMDCISTHDDPDNAKAAAQADYEARFLAALDASPAPPPADHEYCPSMDPNDCGDCIYCGNSAGSHSKPIPAPQPDPLGAAWMRDIADQIDHLGDDLTYIPECGRFKLHKRAYDIAKAIRARGQK